MLNAISYVRVSTPNQDNYGASVDVQRKQIEAFCKVNELRIQRRFKDVGTARNEDDGSEREEFNKAIELSLERQWPIIVATADRFTRTSPVFEDFRRRGGQLIVASEGFGVGEDVIRGKIAAAKANGDLIARRTKIGQREAVKNGKKLGNPNIAEAQKKAQLARSRDARLRRDEFSRHYDRERAGGARSDRGIAEAFNKHGYVTASGKRWTQENVRRMRIAREAASAALGAPASVTASKRPSAAEGPSPAFLEPSLGPKTAPTPQSKPQLKYPGPGHPLGSIVDDRHWLTPHALARLGYLLETNGKDADNFVRACKGRPLSKEEQEAVSGLFERKKGEKLDAILADVDGGAHRIGGCFDGPGNRNPPEINSVSGCQLTLRSTINHNKSQCKNGLIWPK